METKEFYYVKSLNNQPDFEVKTSITLNQLYSKAREIEKKKNIRIYLNYQPCLEEIEGNLKLSELVLKLRQEHPTFVIYSVFEDHDEKAENTKYGFGLSSSQKT